MTSLEPKRPALPRAASDDLTDVHADMPFTAHLLALRTHLIRALVCLFVIFFGLLYFANRLYEMLSAPLRAQLPHGATMIATDISSSFMAPFKLTFFVALILSMPFILHQLWQFVAPALYSKEKRVAVPILLSSIVLFYLGIAFAYFVTLPGILKFFIHQAPASVTAMTDINSYLNFCLKLFVMFGVTFEIPIAVFLMLLARIISVASLRDKRRYIIVGCFFVSMFITPPDPLSMTLLAIPMWLLFEIGLLFGAMLVRENSPAASQ